MILQAAAKDSTGLRFKIGQELQKHQSVKSTIVGLSKRVSNRSTLPNTARDDLHSAMRHVYCSGLPYILAQVARCARDVRVVYHCEVDDQLAA